jgi:hypothetical protein
MESQKHLMLTIEEGNELLRITKAFSLPERLGDNTYTVGDRAIATVDEVGALRRSLREQSPLLQGAERWNCFGPAEIGGTPVWRQVKGELGNIGHVLLKPKEEVLIRIDDDVVAGISWCLLVGLHPSSPVCKAMDVQQDVLWPIARKIGRMNQLRELIGITAKVQPRRWRADEEYAKKEDQVD